MKKTIVLPSRDIPSKLQLVYEPTKLYALESKLSVSVHYQNDHKSIEAVDPSGGPFLMRGSKVENYTINDIFQADNGQIMIQLI